MWFVPLAYPCHTFNDTMDRDAAITQVQAIAVAADANLAVVTFQRGPGGDDSQVWGVAGFLLREDKSPRRRKDEIEPEPTVPTHDL